MKNVRAHRKEIKRVFVHRRFSLDRLVKFHLTDNMKPPEVIIRHAIRVDEYDRHESNEILGAELDGAESDGNQIKRANC